ncbi:hypothetical protein DFH09DRAFT_1108771 [Mycena vulgaris]|nr:hypothetical protein DFH09DRAFT_1108771 [Mycena vulgaris]
MAIQEVAVLGGHLAHHVALTKEERKRHTLSYAKGITLEGCTQCSCAPEHLPGVCDVVCRDTERSEGEHLFSLHLQETPKDERRTAGSGSTYFPHEDLLPFAALSVPAHHIANTREVFRRAAALGAALQSYALRVAEGNMMRKMAAEDGDFLNRHFSDAHEAWQGNLCKRTGAYVFIVYLWKWFHILFNLICLGEVGIHPGFEVFSITPDHWEELGYQGLAQDGVNPVQDVASDGAAHAARNHGRGGSQWEMVGNRDLSGREGCRWEWESTIHYYQLSALTRKWGGGGTYTIGSH